MATKTKQLHVATVDGISVTSDPSKGQELPAESYAPITQAIHIAVSENLSLDIEPKFANEVRAIVVQTGAIYGKYKELWVKFEEKFGARVFERGTDEYKAAKTLLCVANPRWCEAPSRTDTSEQADLQRMRRKHVQDVAQLGLQAMMKHRDAQLKSDGQGATRRAKPFSDKLKAFIETAKKAAESKTLSESEKKIALKIHGGLLAVQHGVLQRLNESLPYMPKPWFDFILKGGKIPESPMVKGQAKLTAEELETIAPDIAVAGKRTVGAKDRKSGAVKVIKPDEQQPETPAAA